MTLSTSTATANVFPCVARQRDIGEVARLRAEGVDPSAAERLFCKFGKAATLILSEPLRLRHLPYPRYRAAEEDIARLPNFAVFSLFPHCYATSTATIKAGNSKFSTVSDLSTLNPKPTTLNAPSPQKAPALPFVCTATQGKTTSAVIPKRSFISPMPETIHSVHAFRLPKDLQAAVSPIGCLPARWTIHSQLAT